MAGLLDFLSTPAGQGLLAGAASYAAGAKRGQPLNSVGKGLLGGLAGYSLATDREAELAQAAKRNQLWDAQLQSYQADAAAKQTAQAREAAKRQALPGLFAGTTTPGSISVPEVGGVEFFSQGAKVQTPSMQTGAGQIDVQRALAAGFDPKEIAELAGLQNIGKPKVARTVEVDDGKGGKATMQLDEFGRPVGQALPAYLAPVQVSRGDRVEFVKPAAGVSLSVNMSPAERDASARGWATVRNAQERLVFDKSKEPAGPKLTEDQAKAAGWLVQATNAHGNMLKAIKADESIAKPGAADGVAAIPGLGGIGNWLRPAERQQFLQGASSLSEALLRAATGAGVNESEAKQKIAELTPQFGDDDKTIKQKMEAIPLYIDSLKMRAGPGAAGAGAVLQKSQEASAKTVVKTGTYGGKKVVQYSDGSVEYAD